MKKSKTDLFRFITLRAPELISADRKLLGFIKHPNPSSSLFLEEIDDGDIESSRIALSSTAAGFTPFPNVQTVKDIEPSVWAFSMWLAKNKNNIQRSELDALIPTTSLSATEVYDIWDNFFYDLITEKNPYIRQACIQILVALNFINNFEEYSPGVTTVPTEMDAEAALLKRLADVRIVVHRVFATTKSTVTVATLASNLVSRSKFEEQHKANVSLLQASVFESIRNEFYAIDKIYQTAYKASFDSYKTTYDEAVTTKINEYFSKNEKAERIAEAEYSIPDGQVNPFAFTFVAPFKSVYAEENLSNVGFKYIEDKGLEEEAIKTAVDQITIDIDNLKKQGSKTKRKKVAEVSVNGVSVKPSSSDFHDFALSFEQNPFTTSNQKLAYFTLDAKSDGAFFTTFNFKLTIGTNEYESICPRYLVQGDNLLFVQLFADETFEFTDCTQFTFEATIELNTGKKLKIYKKGIGGILTISGVAIPIVNAEDEIELYGVNRLGIADYRRVEQELCCYIPGEVSHIENILAKEYKEKSTRNLTRSEDVFESTSEREIEDLTDTTSTSRNEMSTEISEVLQRDRDSNVGFDAGTSGELGKITFNASAFGDFSFGQSSTDSNSIARTYAEDVTKRALERIVTKNTVKRTSRILKEFEENNKHGFDNREGTEHVTGVYRWVDKVYKNRIVNYGKRLIYEFMVPEPARFYKDAIILKAEEEETIITETSSSSPSIAVKPIHPKEQGLGSAKDLTRENYERLASLYGVTIIAPLDATSNVSGGYSESIGNSDAPKSYSYTGLRVPDNYELTKITGSVNYGFKARVNPKAYIVVGTGGKNLSVTEISGEGNDARDISHNMNLNTGDVPVTVNTKKITSFTVSITLECALRASVFEQWQQDAYGDIIRAYETQLQAYNDAQASAEAQKQSDSESDEPTTIQRNPRYNKQIVQTELKRLCIEMITKPFGIQQGRDFYQQGPCDVPELKLSKNLDLYGSQVKFFEQAFDWELMSQLFYPYYWAKKCDWKTLFQATDANDVIFQSFLQSGMGRVMVPIKEGFEDAVTFYMETGKIWGGSGIVLDTDDELYLSIVDELTIIEGELENEEWETIVPTTLTIVQQRSVKLDEGGLPCCDSDDAAELNLDEDTNVLTLKGDTEPTP